jgi:hypothetical protein
MIARIVVVMTVVITVVMTTMIARIAQALMSAPSVDDDHLLSRLRGPTPVTDRAPSP